MGDLFFPDFSGDAASGLTLPVPPSAPGLLFDVRSTVEGPTAVIRVEGDVDLGSAGQLERSVISAVEAGASNLVLDLGRVSFLDCTGLRVLLNARQLAGSRGGLLRLDSVPARVRRVLLLTGAGVLLEPDPDTWPTMR